MIKKINFIWFTLFLTLQFSTKSQIFACTIVSAVASDGQVWTCNNEDGPIGVANFISVFPKSGQMKYGYFSLSYFSPKLGEGGNMQGGMNEAGLTFDFNAINQVKGFNPKSKKEFPMGDEQILPYILGTMSTVQEVIEFFKIYWFQNGFHSAQMHVADRLGRFAIISASGIKLMEKGQSLVSTNFDICGKEDGSTCWRYPKAISNLKSNEAGFNTMMAICKETAQGEMTLYSNIQNLTTGDVWFFSKHNPEVMVKTNIADLLLKGRKSYSFSDLNSLIENRPISKVTQPTRIELADNIKENYIGTYHNDFTGQLVVEADKDGIKITSSDGNSNIVQAQSENTFFFPDEDVQIIFLYDNQRKHMTLKFYENGNWIFDAWKQDLK